MSKLKKKLSAIIIDKDEKGSLSIKKMCENYFATIIEIVEIFNSPYKAVRIMSQLDIEIDVIFIDSQLSSQSVMSFIATKPFGERSKFVFLSNDDKHILNAIRFGVLDYLRKPCRLREFKMFINRLQGHFKDRVEPMGDGISDNILIVNGHDKALFLDVCEIVRIEAHGSYSDIYMMKGQTISSSKSLSFYQNLLERHKFIKVHRSHLINVNRVKEILKHDGEGVIVMEDKSKISISRGKKNDLLRSFTK